MHSEDTTSPSGEQVDVFTVPLLPYERTRLIWRSGLATNEKAVLTCIADHLSADGRPCWPSLSTLAAMTSLCLRSVRRTIRGLEAAGVLDVSPLSGQSNHYRIAFGALPSTPDCGAGVPRTVVPGPGGGEDCGAGGGGLTDRGGRTVVPPKQTSEADQEADHIHNNTSDPSGGTPDGVECGPVENPVDNLSTQETTPLEADPAPGTGDTPQQTLIPTEGSAAAPPAADPAAALWISLEAIRREIDPSAKAWKLTASRRKAINARLREHTADEIRAVWRWWLTSPHSRATYLRDHGYTAETILRPGNLATYVEMAGQSRQTTLTGADAWEEVLEALAYWQAQPPWVRWGDVEAWAFADDEDPQIHARYAGGLKAAGGTNDVLTAWRNLYRAASDYDRRQQRSAFCAAWTRSGLREVA